MKQLSDRTAVVTGAASGIGLGLVERFIKEGMNVVLADVEERALEEVTHLLRSQGATVLAVQTDVSSRSDMKRLAKRTLETFGAMHVVCNNAGIDIQPSECWAITAEEWDWVLNVNLKGVIHGIHTFVPIMLEQGTEGHIVNTSSIAGHFSAPLMAAYHVTKFGVVALTECLHHELRMINANIHVSLLSPAFVISNIKRAERNRPSVLAGLDRPLSEIASAVDKKFKEGLKQGLSPSVVAEHVVDAILNEKFYIFTHKDEMAMVQKRYDNLLAFNNPEMLLPGG